MQGERFSETELFERIKRMYEKKKDGDSIVVLTATEYTKQVQNLIDAQVKIYEETGKLSSKGKLQKEIFELRGQLERMKKLNEELMKRIKDKDEDAKI